jgi:hypothetical protein
MVDTPAETQTSGVTRARKMWWLLPVLVLIMLIGVIYFLEHMSSADSEMYPTTERQHATCVLLC